MYIPEEPVTATYYAFCCCDAGTKLMTPERQRAIWAIYGMPPSALKHP